MRNWAMGLVCVAAIGGCSTVADYYDSAVNSVFGVSRAEKPAALVPIKPTAAPKILWRASIAGAGGYAFAPAVTATGIYVAGADGQIARIAERDGKLLWRVDAKTRLSGGVGSDGSVVVVGTPRGEVLAFEAASGKQLWKAQVTSEVLAAPQVADGFVVVRSGDNRIFGLDAATGVRKWFYQRQLPPLAVRSFAGVAISRGAVFVGFPGGRLVALSLSNGALGWEVPVALPRGATELERVADVASLPLVELSRVCAIAFQGRVACFDITKGSQVWARDVSSFAGMGVDARALYITDDKNAVVALDKAAGASLWKQDKLARRRVSAPLPVGRYVVVGDVEGYVHVLSREDGSFAARIATDGSPINSPPVALDDGFLVQTRNGGIFALAVQ